jgi:ATP-dependent RNA helicase DeaD
MISFQESGLKPQIIEAIEKMGFSKPTPIQAECIPFILESKNDLIANAQTGTGKTAAFGLPIIDMLDSARPYVQALILSPTRELAIQITNELEKYASLLNHINIVAVYGGASAETQIAALRRGAQIVVGTPGRVLDLINRKKLIVDQIKWLVLDEADEMLNMGFKDELDGILETTPSERQTLLFSATLPAEIVQISRNYMYQPKEIAVSKRNVGAENIEHFAYMVNAKDKYAALKRIADINPRIYAIVFCRTRQETKEVADKLIRDGYNADALHGDLSQAQRETVMKRFRIGNLQILVATDVAARGLDVDDLTHVINYSMPDEAEVYVHRSGRTGRAGKNGVAISIIHTRENRKIQDIQKLIGKKIVLKDIPSGRDICQTQLMNLVSHLEEVDLSNAEIDNFMDVIYQKLESMSKEEVIKRFVATEFTRFLDYYKNAKDLNVSSHGDSRERGDGYGKDRGQRGDYGRERSSRGSDREGSYRSGSDRKSDRSPSARSGSDRDNPKRDRASNTKFQRFYVNIGAKDAVNPGTLIGLINKATPDLSVPIGQIEILKKFSFFEVESKFSKKVLEGINGLTHRGVEILAEPSENPKPAEAKPKPKPRGDFQKDSSKQRRSKKQW